MNEKIFADVLVESLAGFADPDDYELDVTSARTYENAGILTGNAGLVVNFADGSQYQITIVQSKQGDGYLKNPGGSEVPGEIQGGE